MYSLQRVLIQGHCLLPPLPVLQVSSSAIKYQVLTPTLGGPWLWNSSRCIPGEYSKKASFLFPLFSAPRYAYQPLAETNTVYRQKLSDIVNDCP